jgi:hypothetical protein
MFVPVNQTSLFNLWLPLLPMVAILYASFWGHQQDEFSYVYYNKLYHKILFPAPEMEGLGWWRAFGML